MAIASILRVDEGKSRELSSGRIKVIMLEKSQTGSGRMKDRKSPPKDSAILAEMDDNPRVLVESNMSQKRKLDSLTLYSKHDGQRNYVNLISDDDMDDIEDPIMDRTKSDSPFCGRVQLMLLMLPQLNVAIRERMNVSRAPFNTSVQSKVRDMGEPVEER